MLCRAVSAHLRVGKEQLLAGYLILGDGGLTMPAQQPADQRPAARGINVRVAVRVDQDHAVLVKELVIASDEYGEIRFVAEGYPGGSVGEGVSS